MKQLYTISGMTCNGCREGVEKKLSAVDGVKMAQVNLENSAAEIEMENYIPISVFQSALSEKYNISEKLIESNTQTKTTKKSDWRQLFPLFLILGYITIASILLNLKPFSGSGFMLDFMGLFYIVFGFFKMLDLKGFPDSFIMYDPLAKKIPLYANVYPFIETILGLFFLMRFEIEMALVATMVILGITTIGVTKVLLDKKSIQCACLGTVLKLPMTKATIIENSLMILMAIAMIIYRH